MPVSVGTPWLRFAPDDISSGGVVTNQGSDANTLAHFTDANWTDATPAVDSTFAGGTKNGLDLGAVSVLRAWEWTRASGSWAQPFMVATVVHGWLSGNLRDRHRAGGTRYELRNSAMRTNSNLAQPSGLDASDGGLHLVIEFWGNSAAETSGYWLDDLGLSTGSTGANVTAAGGILYGGRYGAASVCDSGVIGGVIVAPVTLDGETNMATITDALHDAVKSYWTQADFDAAVPGLDPGGGSSYDEVAPLAVLNLAEESASAATGHALQQLAVAALQIDALPASLAAGFAPVATTALLELMSFQHTGEFLNASGYDLVAGLALLNTESVQASAAYGYAPEASLALLSVASQSSSLHAGLSLDAGLALLELNGLSPSLAQGMAAAAGLASLEIEALAALIDLGDFEPDRVYAVLSITRRLNAQLRILTRIDADLER